MLQRWRVGYLAVDVATALLVAADPLAVTVVYHPSFELGASLRMVKIQWIPLVMRGTVRLSGFAGVEDTRIRTLRETDRSAEKGKSLLVEAGWYFVVPCPGQKSGAWRWGASMENITNGGMRWSSARVFRAPRGSNWTIGMDSKFSLEIAVMVGAQGH